MQLLDKDETISRHIMIMIHCRVIMTR